MWIWIVIAAVVITLAVFAFWPRRRGIADGEVRQSRLRDKGNAENYNNPSGPNFSGPM